MANSIYPCLWFDGNAKAAADFYSSVFEDANITVDTPLVVIFELHGKKFMSLNGGPKFKINYSVSFFVNCNSPEEVEEKWKLLTEGGSVMMPLNSYPWSPKYGWCQDKFGVNWQLMTGGTMGDEKIVPSLMFTNEHSGKTEEAINFYTTVFPNSSVKALNRYEEGEPDIKGYIKHGQFYLQNQLFTAMGSTGPHTASFNEAISFVVDCKDQQEIDYYWKQLTADGGQESMCGWLKDKYGLSWQIVPTIIGKLMSDPEKAPRVMQAVMQMKKLDIEKMINA